jgi:hypothetical protein
MLGAQKKGGMGVCKEEPAELLWCRRFFFSLSCQAFDCCYGVSSLCGFGGNGGLHEG